MDYSTLSDLEIAILVGKHFPDEVIVSEDYAYKLIPCAASAYTGIDYEEVDFDPCNNVYDAWPIIIKNNITIINDKDCYPRATNDSYTFINEEFDECVHYLDKKPLRAAMIVFLMLMENVDGGLQQIN